MWLGDADAGGPTLFEDEVINGKLFPGSLRARIAAELVDIQLEQSPGRCKAMPFQEGPLVRKDTVATKMTTLKALTLKEEGKVI